MRCKVKIEFLSKDSYLFKVRFFNFKGTRVGTLVRPTHECYAINKNASAIEFMEFIADARLGNSSVLPIDSERIKFKFEYFERDDRADGRNALGIIIDHGPRDYLNEGSEYSFRHIWNDLIRFGFRPRLDDFR